MRFFDFKHGQSGVADNAVELHPVFGFKPVIVTTELPCVECGAIAEGRGKGWRLYRADLEDEDQEPELVAYCPECAAQEFD